jgi:hypothetical protein
LDNAGIIVDDLEGTIDFFCQLGVELRGWVTNKGERAGRVAGLGNQRVELAMMRTPDSHGWLELSRFLTPSAIANHRNAPLAEINLIEPGGDRGFTCDYPCCA